MPGELELYLIFIGQLALIMGCGWVIGKLCDEAAQYFDRKAKENNRRKRNA